MKIGILTYHHVMNYGAVLQAYALSRYLRDCGHDVETIDYRPIKALEAYHKAFFENNPHEAEHRIRAERFEAFIQSEMPLSPRAFHTREGFADLQSRYDAVITGSDEVWNINSFRGYDPSYFLDFAEGARRVSYAASFGFTSTTGVHREQIARMLAAFHALGVRDNHTMRIVREECGLSSTKTLDPTLLLEDYNRILKPPAESGYVLVYSNSSQAEVELIRRFAAQMGKSVIAIGYAIEGAINVMTASPAEWVGYFAAADYIFNGFFHGVAFSLIFRKPFTAFSSAQKIMKMGDLLGDFGLADRIISVKDGHADLPSPEVDYTPVESRLKAVIEASRAFLRNALPQPASAAAGR